MGNAPAQAFAQNWNCQGSTHLVRLAFFTFMQNSIKILGLKLALYTHTSKGPPTGPQTGFKLTCTLYTHWPQTDSASDELLSAELLSGLSSPFASSDFGSAGTAMQTVIKRIAAMTKRGMYLPKSV